MKSSSRGIAGRMLFLVAAFSAAMLILAACGGGGGGTSTTGGGGGGGAGATTLNVTETEFKIDPNNLSAKAGQITFHITNKGSVEHDIGVIMANGSVEHSPLVPAGQSADWTVTVNTPGTYRIECTVPGHAEAGMTGMLNVTS